MPSKIRFKKITFNNIDSKKFKKYIVKSGLFVFPAGPAIASIEKSESYYQALKKADLVFFDSGFFVLLLPEEKGLVFLGAPNKRCPSRPPNQTLALYLH